MRTKIARSASLHNILLQFLVHNQFFLLILVLLLFLGLFNKMLLVAVVFSLLDFLTSYIDLYFKIDILPDFALLGAIIVSYNDQFSLVYMIVIFWLFSRVSLAKFEKRHIVKIPLFFIIASLAMLFNKYPLSIIGPLLVIVRFLSEYLIEFILNGKVDFRLIPRRLIHTWWAFLLFQVMF